MKKELQHKTGQIFANIGKLITSSLDSREILHGIMVEVMIYFDPQSWSLLRLDKSSDELFFIIFEGKEVCESDMIRLDIGEGIAGLAARTGELVFVPDITKDSRFCNRVDRFSGFKTRSIIAAPIIFRDEVYGVIEIVNPENITDFTNEDHVILKTIADFSAIALTNSMLHEKIVSQSITDPLTGLFNRLKLNAVIDEMSNESSPKRRSIERNRGKKIYTIYLDLDNFKEINDTFGHREGDKVLKSFASQIKSVMRADDMVFRVGGDEFLVIVSVPDTQEKSRVISRIEDVLSTIKCESSEIGYSVTFSHGIASGSSAEINNLISRSDQRMYDKKKS
jgi:diguanylate cyclase (GGDEF)-like protein